MRSDTEPSRAGACPVILRRKSSVCLRLISEVLESNGSSAMLACACSTLALWTVVVPIKRPRRRCGHGAGQEDEPYVILSDIQGLEGPHGGHDFKVAGTADGITALRWT